MKLLHLVFPSREYLEKETDMTSCIPELVASLNNKRNELEDLLKLTRQEQRCIIDIDIVGLENIDLQKRELLISMERTNAECRYLIKKVSQEFKLDNVDSLSLILPRVAQPLRDKLKDIQSTLLELGDSLNKTLEFNKVLLSGTLDHVHDSINFLRSFFSSSSTYGQAGGMIRTQEEVRLVCKEI